MSLPRPPWHFRYSERPDRPRFKAWLDLQLDDIYIPEDMALQVQRDNDPAYEKAVSEGFIESIIKTMSREQVIRAARERNIPLIEQLTAHDPVLTSLAIRELAYKRGRGREKGEWRAGDFTPEFGVALIEFRHARAVMKQHYGRWSGAAATVLEIVAERCGIDPERLRKFFRNQRFS